MIVKNMLSKMFVFICTIASCHQFKINSMVNFVTGVKEAEILLTGTNAALGTYSRTLGVSQATLAVRGAHDQSDVTAYQQAMVTLAVLDVGGATLVPVVQDIIDTITDVDGDDFVQTLNAFEQVRENMAGAVGDMKKKCLTTKSDCFTKIVKTLKNKKQHAMDMFDQNSKAFIDKLKNGKFTLPKFKNIATRFSKTMGKVKKLFKLKHFGKALGPLFDVIGIGVNAWALATEIEKCRDVNTECNWPGIWSASLSIASGVVGVITFVAALKVSAAAASVLSPAGTILALALGIAATAIEIHYSGGWTAFWNKNKIVQNEYAEALFKHSRQQLYATHEALAATGDIRVFAINQAHLPFFEPGHNRVRFNGDEKPKIQPFSNVCSNTSQVGECQYITLGDNITGYDIAGESPFLGAPYYGFQRADFNSTDNDIKSPKELFIFVNTDRVILEEQRKINPKLGKNTRGIEIKKHEMLVNTIVTIGDMELIDRGKKVHVNLERASKHLDSCNNSLVINGVFGYMYQPDHYKNILYARLGDGRNTLSLFGLNGLSATTDVTGIRFNYHATDGKLEYWFTYNNEDKKIFHVGKVQGVTYIYGSRMDDDYIKLYNKKHFGDKEPSFIALKFLGKATYEINMWDEHKSLTGTTPKEVKHYKIIDTSKNGDKSKEDRCEGHQPTLFISDLHKSSGQKDIRLKGNTIEIYSDLEKQYTQQKHKYRKPTECTKEEDSSKPSVTEKLAVVVTIESTCPIHVIAMTEEGTCVIKRPMYDLERFSWTNGRKGNFTFSDSEKFEGSQDENDEVSLVCRDDGRMSTPRTYIDLNGSQNSKNVLVIGRDSFLDPCYVTGMTLKLDSESDEKEIYFTVSPPKVTIKLEAFSIKGINYIYNEFGIKLYPLEGNNEEKIDLLRIYEEKEESRIVRENADDEIKDELLICRGRKTNEETASDLSDICD